jgi:chromosome segregation ATPase
MKHEGRKPDEQKGMHEEKKAYEEKLEEKIEDIEHEMEKVKTKSEHAEEQKQDLRHMLDDLKVKREQARKRLGELRSAGSDTWKSVKSRADATLEDLKKFGERVFHK